MFFTAVAAAPNGLALSRSILLGKRRPSCWPSDISGTLLPIYEGTTPLASTYVGYARGTGGTADFGAYPSGTTSQRSYIRVDGPRVWIEFVVQQGVIYSAQVHYHSIWRDKVGDYGGQFGNGSTSFSGT